MKRLTISLMLSATLAVVPVFAQDQTATPAAGDQPASSTAEGAAIAEFTPEVVDPADPFGEIDVTNAGATEEEVTTFFNALTPEQQTEISARCAVIMDPVHQERYSEETATVLCNNLVSFNLAPMAAQ